MGGFTGGRVIMKVGLDFDGVIADSQKLKSQIAKKIYKVDIPPDIFKKEIVVNDRKILSHEQYRKIQKLAFATREWGMLMEPLEGVSEYFTKLLAENKVKIITTRGKPESEIAAGWMVKNGLPVPEIIPVGYGVPKTEACKGLDVYVDDDFDKLQPLEGIVPYRLLFSWLYNEDVNEEGIMRIRSWKELYDFVKKLKNNS